MQWATRRRVRSGESPRNRARDILAPMPESVLLQSRDFELLKGLFESRVLTLSHIASLHFEGRDEAAKKRVQKLKAGGFIGERPRRVNEPGILFLTRKGFTALESEGLLS